MTAGTSIQPAGSHLPLPALPCPHLGRGRPLAGAAPASCASDPPSSRMKSLISGGSSMPPSSSSCAQQRSEAGHGVWTRCTAVRWAAGGACRRACCIPFGKATPGCNPCCGTNNCTPHLHAAGRGAAGATAAGDHGSRRLQVAPHGGALKAAVRQHGAPAHLLHLAQQLLGLQGVATRWPHVS